LCRGVYGTSYFRAMCVDRGINRDLWRKTHMKKGECPLLEHVSQEILMLVYKDMLLVEGQMGAKLDLSPLSEKADTSVDFFDLFTFSWRKPYPTLQPSMSLKRTWNDDTLRPRHLQRFAKIFLQWNLRPSEVAHLPKCHFILALHLYVKVMRKPGWLRDLCTYIVENRDPHVLFGIPGTKYEETAEHRAGREALERTDRQFDISSNDNLIADLIRTLNPPKKTSHKYMSNQTTESSPELFSPYPLLDSLAHESLTPFYPVHTSISTMEIRQTGNAISRSVETLHVDTNKYLREQFMTWHHMDKHKWPWMKQHRLELLQAHNHSSFDEIDEVTNQDDRRNVNTVDPGNVDRMHVDQREVAYTDATKTQNTETSKTNMITENRNKTDHHSDNHAENVENHRENHIKNHVETHEKQEKVQLYSVPGSQPIKITGTFPPSNDSTFSRVAIPVPSLPTHSSLPQSFLDDDFNFNFGGEPDFDDVLASVFLKSSSDTSSALTISSSIPSLAISSSIPSPIPSPTPSSNPSSKVISVPYVTLADMLKKSRFLLDIVEARDMYWECREGASSPYHNVRNYYEDEVYKLKIPDRIQQCGSMPYYCTQEHQKFMDAVSAEGDISQV